MKTNIIITDGDIRIELHATTDMEKRLLEGLHTDQQRYGLNAEVKLHVGPVFATQEHRLVVHVQPVEEKA